MCPRCLPLSASVLSTAIALLTLAPTGAAQAVHGLDTANAGSFAASLARSIRVPIHTAAPVDNIEYGIWAAGPNYKVSFHDGFAIYPVLGEDYPENLPLEWHTESVTCGGAPVFAEGTAPETAFTDWRFEYRYPGFVEAYDVRADGVEQTFTLLRRPSKRGDLVVIGRIASRLTADDAPAAHEAVLFQGPEGEAIVRYGEAFAFDALGAKTPLQAACDGERITLRVPAAWLERAVFPVTIDPLVSAVAMAGASSRPYLDVDMAAPARFNMNQPDKGYVYVAYSLSVSASDSDTFLVQSPSGAATPTLLYCDVTSLWSTPRVAVAHATHPYGISEFSSVVVVTQRVIVVNGTQTSSLAWYVRTSGVGTAAGSLHSWNIARRNPDVGGTVLAEYSSARVCVVWEQDEAFHGTNTQNTEIYQAEIDLSTGSMGAPRIVAAAPVGNQLDREYPSVSDWNPWVVVYQERPSAGSTFEVHATMFDSYLRVRGRTSFPADSGEYGPPQPKVGGLNDLFLVAYRNGANCSTRRIDWNYSQGVATVGAARALPYAGRAADVAFDMDTRSHFGVAVSGVPETGSSQTWSENRVYRLGHSGGIVEDRLLGHGGTAATTSLAYVQTLYPAAGSFVVTHQRHTERRDPRGTLAARYELLSHRVQHDPAVGNTLYGVGCAGDISATTPYAGIGDFTVMLSNAGPAGQPAYLYVSTLPDAIVVTPSCWLNIDPSAVIGVHPATIDTSGSAAVTFPLPDDPVFLGSYYMQWMFYDGVSSYQMTQGLRAEVRF